MRGLPDFRLASVAWPAVLRRYIPNDLRRSNIPAGSNTIQDSQLQDAGAEQGQGLTEQVVEQENDAGQWRAAQGAQYGTECQSTRPLHQPG